jgi:hypothetical protein
MSAGNWPIWHDGGLLSVALVVALVLLVACTWVGWAIWARWTSWRDVQRADPARRARMVLGTVDDRLGRQALCSIDRLERSRQGCGSFGWCSSAPDCRHLACPSHAASGMCGRIDTSLDKTGGATW